MTPAERVFEADKRIRALGGEVNACAFIYFVLIEVARNGDSLTASQIADRFEWAMNWVEDTK